MVKQYVSHHDKKFEQENRRSKHRRQDSANGAFDKIAIKAEKYSDIRVRRASPPHWLLMRVLDCVERIHAIDIEGYVSSRGRGLDAQELEMAKSAREKALDRAWNSYRIIQNSQLLYDGKDTKDESWNNAKRTKEGFESEPLVYLGSTTELETFDGWYNHGDKAKGRTTPKFYNDNWDLGGNGDEE